MTRPVPGTSMTRVDKPHATDIYTQYQFCLATQDDQCRQSTCHCDKEAAECFGRYKDEYNRDNLKNIGKLLSDIQHLLG